MGGSVSPPCGRDGGVGTADVGLAAGQVKSQDWVVVVVRFRI